MTAEIVPALVLLNLRRIAKRAVRHNACLDPELVLDIIEGKRKA